MSSSILKIRVLPVAAACVVAACAPQQDTAPPASTPEPTPASLSVSMSTQVDTPAADVWKVVGDFGGIGRFMDDIENVDVEGEGVGAVRTLHLAGGARVIETLTAWDGEAMRYSYTIRESPLPVKGYEGTMTVSELEGGRSRVDWQSTFQAAGVSDEEARQSVAGIYEAGLAGLKKLFSNGAADEGEAAGQ